MEQHIKIREATENDKEQCEFILCTLPEWFGIESATAEYVQDIRRMLTYVASCGADVRGFLSLNRHNSYTSEIHVMAVRREFHGSGLGKALIKQAETICRELGVEYLEVKTLGNSRINEHYERTRRFYFSCGFRPLEELEGVWAGNPCLLMVKKL
jgi:GNAT superfamily N-acetyltransferase